MDKKEIVSSYIKQEIIRNQNVQLDENEDLIETGLLDSLGILQLVAYISDTFGIEVPDEDIVHENFQSVEVINNYLQRYS